MLPGAEFPLLCPSRSTFLPSSFSALSPERLLAMKKVVLISGLWLLDSLPNWTPAVRRKEWLRLTHLVPRPGHSLASCCILLKEQFQKLLFHVTLSGLGSKGLHAYYQSM